MPNNWATIPQMILAQSAVYQNRAVLKVKRSNQYEDISWSQLWDQAQEIALGLLDLGIEPDDRVAILSENRPEWVAADLGILSSGAVTVPIYTSLTPQEIEYLLKDSQAKAIFISTPELAAKVFNFREPSAIKIILFDAPYRVSGPKVWWLGELMGLGKTASAQVKENLSHRIQQRRAQDLCSIIYTSGTTGHPKGVMLTHDNFLSNCKAIQAAIPIREDDLLLSFLPLSHVFERTAGYYFVLSVGGTIAYAENMDKVAQNLLEVSPTVLTGVPRFYEKFRDRVAENVQQASGFKRRLFYWAIAVGKRRARAGLSGRRVGPWLALEGRFTDLLVFSKLRARLGGRLRFCVSGGAALPQELAEFFYAVGILIVEGYGLTETSPVITCNRVDRFRFGTVGLPLPGVEVRIAPDGEILTRGPHVMKGYFQNPQATAEAIDTEGWFYTGDVGQIDADGFLKITDRKKDLIKTSGGKMIAPQNLEETLKKDAWIADGVVVGEGRKYVTALILPDLEKLQAYAAKHHLANLSTEELLKRPEITDLIWKRVERINEQLASFEKIKKIALIHQPFSIATGELTPTLKVKRRVVSERYAQEIEALYQE